MLNLLELLFYIGDAFSSWRFYLCVLVSVPIAVWLHNSFGHDIWVWCLSVPIVLAGIIGGFVWKIREDKT